MHVSVLCAGCCCCCWWLSHLTSVLSAVAVSDHDGSLLVEEDLEEEVVTELFGFAEEEKEMDKCVTPRHLGLSSADLLKDTGGDNEASSPG
jgi:hypothetical protein